MQVEPAPHGADELLGALSELDHRSEVDALMRCGVVVHAFPLVRVATAARKEDVHLA